MIETITILGGHNRAGVPEAVERIDMKMGDVISIVGPTGSGKTKTRWLNKFANSSSPWNRRWPINACSP